jgi:hypothetical protein
MASNPTGFLILAAYLALIDFKLDTPRTNHTAYPTLWQGPARSIRFLSHAGISEIILVKSCHVHRIRTAMQIIYA